MTYKLRLIRLFVGGVRGDGGEDTSELLAGRCHAASGGRAYFINQRAVEPNPHTQHEMERVQVLEKKLGPQKYVVAYVPAWVKPGADINWYVMSRPAVPHAPGGPGGFCHCRAPRISHPNLRILRTTSMSPSPFPGADDFSVSSCNVAWMRVSPGCPGVPHATVVGHPRRKQAGALKARRWLYWKRERAKPS